MGLVDGTIPKSPVTTIVELTELLKKDGQAISFLCAALNDFIIHLVCGCTSSKAIWDYLKTIHD